MCTPYTIAQLQTGLIPATLTGSTTAEQVANLLANTAEMATLRCQIFSFWLAMLNARKYVQEDKCCCPYTITWSVRDPLPNPTTLSCQNMAEYYNYVILVTNQNSGFAALVMAVVLYMRRQSYLQQQVQDGKAVCTFYTTCG